MSLRPFAVQLREGMTVPGAGDLSKLMKLERTVLRFLCSEELDDASRVNARRRLVAYVWHDEEHRVVFESLTRVRNPNLIPIRAQLAEHATRMGFPDVDWQSYLQPAETMTGSTDQQKLELAIEVLVAAHAEQR
jgi:hypothetical protein